MSRVTRQTIRAREADKRQSPQVRPSWPDRCYRRFVIGRTLLAGGRWQVKNLRSRDTDRLQVCATGAASTLTTYWRRTRRASRRVIPFKVDRSGENVFMLITLGRTGQVNTRGFAKGPWQRLVEY